MIGKATFFCLPLAIILAFMVAPSQQSALTAAGAAAGAATGALAEKKIAADVAIGAKALGGAALGAKALAAKGLDIKALIEGELAKLTALAVKLKAAFAGAVLKDLGFKAIITKVIDVIKSVEAAELPILIKLFVSAAL